MRSKYKMRSNIKNEDLLKIQPFFSEEIKNFKKRKKNYISKKLSNIQLSKELPFFPKSSKRSKRLTKYQILSNIWPLFDTVRITRRYPFRRYAGSFDVEVMDSTSLDDSLFLTKRSIINFFKDLLEEKRGFQ